MHPWLQRGSLAEPRSHQPCNGAGEKVLVVEADAARHSGVSLPEHLRHALELRARLDEAVQLYAVGAAPIAEALHQHLRKLGAELVAHLS